MKIFADTNQLHERGNEMNVINNQLKSVMEQIEAMVLSLDGSWQGDAERAFAAQIIMVKKNYSDVWQFFDDCSELLKTFADQYSINDDRLASKISLT